MVYSSGKGHVLIILLECQVTRLIKGIRKYALFNGSASRRRKPLKELNDMEACEWHSQRGRIVAHLDEDMDEDDLAEDEEVVKGSTHP